MQKTYHNNAIKRIELYKLNEETWAFDDEYLGIKAEPFVLGASDVISVIVDGASNIKDRERPIALFSEHVIPRFNAVIHLKEDLGNNAWYEYNIPGTHFTMQLWLCSVLSMFFKEPLPKTIYIKFE